MFKHLKNDFKKSMLEGVIEVYVNDKITTNEDGKVGKDSKSSNSNLTKDFSQPFKLVKQMLQFKNDSDESMLEKLAEYYVNGEMTEKEFNKAKKELKLSNFTATIAACNSHKLSKQTLLSQEVMRSEKRATGYAPIGYRNVRHRNGKYNVVVDDKKVFYIKRLFNLYATTSFTLDLMVMIAKNWGLVGKITQKPLTKQAIKYILSNPFYCGYARHNGQLYKHCYKAIISVEEFSRCQSKLKRQGYIK